MKLQSDRFALPFFRRSLIGAAVLALCAGPAFAVNPFVVKDIRVEGIQRTEAGTVFSYLPVRVGETFNDDKSIAAIKALYATGFFKDVRLEEENGVLVVLVEERPAIATRRLHRHQGIREGHAGQGAEGNRRRRSQDLRQGVGRPRRAGTQAPVPVARPVRRQDHHHRHPDRTQPRHRHVQRRRRRRRAHQADQHRRQQDLLGQGTARACCS